MNTVLDRTTMLTVVVIDADVFDDLFGETVRDGQWDFYRRLTEARQRPDLRVSGSRHRR